MEYAEALKPQKKINILIMSLTLKNIFFNLLDGEECNKQRQIFLSVLWVQERDGQIQSVVMSRCIDDQPCYVRLFCLIFCCVHSWKSRESKNWLLPEFLFISESVKRIAMSSYICVCPWGPTSLVSHKQVGIILESRTLKLQYWPSLQHFS